MKRTDEQLRIVEEATNSTNLQIRAYAGCGKTTALELLDWEMPPTPRLYLAFNKRIVEEMTTPDPVTKETPLRLSTECRTINSLGHRVWMQAISPRLVLNTKKTNEIFKEVVKPLSSEARRDIWEVYGEISTAVGLAKAFGYIPEGCTKWDKRLIGRKDFFSNLEDKLSIQAQEIVDQILALSIKRSYLGNIDFDDQIYMPALFGGSFPQFPTIMVDEAQDLSPVNHLIVKKLGKNSRVISVGDPFQSIYGFRGAATDGMDKQQVAFNMVTLPLSVSFRCASEIVKNARWRAPGFKWLREGGRVGELRHLTSPADNSAVICRNNAPLFRMAIHLLSEGRSVRVAGSDIGPRIAGILRKFGDQDLPRSAVLGAIDSWLAKRNESSSAPDMAECLRIFANHTKDLGQAVAYAKYIFDQDGTITLITGHKSKGLEWDTVYHLDPWLIKTSEQEMNLRYVIQTRARDNYFEVDSEKS